MFRKLYSLQQKIFEHSRRTVEDGVPIFMVHHVTNFSIEERSNLSIRTSEFKTFIERLAGEGYCFIRPDQLEQSFGKKTCMITFDDIFKDAFDNGISFLEDNHIPYLCFISPGYLGKEKYIDGIDLKRLQNSSCCTIGAHSINHRLFRELLENEKIKEISNKEHELLLGCEIKDFAFPYGSLYACDSFSVKVARQEYSRVYSTLNFQSIKGDIGGMLPRINLNSEYVSRK